LTLIINTAPQRHTPALTTAAPTAGLALFALLALGMFVVPAAAQPRHDYHHRDDRRFEHRDFHHGGYYPAPPVVYGGPVYAPPPVVYGPAVGIALPGISINIR
jgi:hypothetical protein